MQLYDTRPITIIKGVGPARARHLAKLNIHTIQDFLEHYPLRYEDRSAITSIAALQENELQTFRATVVSIQEKKSFRKGRALTITSASVRDNSGVAELVWFNQPHIKKNLKTGAYLIISGRIEKNFGKIEIKNNLEFEPIEKFETPVGKIVPVYGATGDLSQKVLRSIAGQALDSCLKLDETLPEEIISQHALLERNAAIRAIHFPPSRETLNLATHRLVFEELYLLQCALLNIKQNQKHKHVGIRHASDGVLTGKLMKSLPFALTEGQINAFNEIKQDMEEPLPMHRLLQGDVGSGKTILAIIALVKTVENGFQGAMMAPTEILAEQHYQTMQTLLSQLSIRVALLSGSIPAKNRMELLQQIAAGQVDIVVGTHALIQESVEFAHLGLVVTDEQHRFGVEQRAKLQEKGKTPDVLVMTATPIPRTMALTVYGDLDVSTLRELPPGRKPIKTYFVGMEMRRRVYTNLILKEVAAGRQAYVVCPLIEESEHMDIQSVLTLYAELKQEYLSNVTCALFHGRMNQKEREAVMQSFYSGDIKVLVATTIIEVGVNVPNATVMVIEDAHRFGLAQLHQLRGRIGRGQHQSYCVLISDSTSKDSRERLQTMTETQDGFALAERDLILRGPGEFLGTRQHGIPELKIADVLRDFDILTQARSAALETIKADKQHDHIAAVLCQRFGEKKNITQS